MFDSFLHTSYALQYLIYNGERLASGISSLDVMTKKCGEAENIPEDVVG